AVPATPLLFSVQPVPVVPNPVITLPLTPVTSTDGTTVSVPRLADRVRLFTVTVLGALAPGVTAIVPPPTRLTVPSVWLPGGLAWPTKLRLPARLIGVAAPSRWAT